MESQVDECYPSTGAIVKTPMSFRTEQRSVIKYCANAGMTPTDTFKFMERDPNRKVSRTIVFDWYRLYKDDREELENSSKVGRPTLSDRMFML